MSDSTSGGGRITLGLLNIRQKRNPRMLITIRESSNAEYKTLTTGRTDATVEKRIPISETAQTSHV